MSRQQLDKEVFLRRMGVAPSRAGARELRRAWLRWTVATLAAILVGGFLAGMFVAARYEAQLGQVHREMSTLREQLRREEPALRERVALYQGVVELLRDPATRVIALRGAGPTPGAQGRIVWHDRTGGHVFLSRLPPAPEGLVYALWTISGGRPRPAGLFQVDASGQAGLRIPPAGGPVESFTVTLEPAGGVPAPTGRVVLVPGQPLAGSAGRLGGSRAPSASQPEQRRDDESQRPQPQQGSGERPTDDDGPAPPSDKQ